MSKNPDNTKSHRSIYVIFILAAATALLCACLARPSGTASPAATPQPDPGAERSMASDGDRPQRFFTGSWRTPDGVKDLEMREWHTNGKVYGVVQGDIVLGLKKDLEVVEGDRSLHAGLSRPWPLAIIPYKVRGDLVQRNAFLGAIRTFGNVKDPATGRQVIHFIEQSSPSCPAAVRETYLDVQNTTDARVGGRAQYGRARSGAHEVWLNVDPRKCDLSVIVHELMHSLGMAHEQCRSDRDDYVRIDFNQLDPNFESEFRKFPLTLSRGLYDYWSATHYHRNAFAIQNGGPTIIPRSQSEIDRLPPARRVRAVRITDIGRAEKPSAGDINGIMAIHGDEFRKRVSQLGW